MLPGPHRVRRGLRARHQRKRRERRDGKHEKAERNSDLRPHYWPMVDPPPVPEPDPFPDPAPDPFVLDPEPLGFWVFVPLRVPLVLVPLVFPLVFVPLLLRLLSLPSSRFRWVGLERLSVFGLARRADFLCVVVFFARVRPEAVSLR
jgi:hypothetical protein